MPLKQGSSKATIQENTERLIQEGKSPSQAYAIANSVAKDEGESARRVDDFGWITIEDNPISKVGVFPYSGRQIGAPDPDAIYYVFRPPEELSNPETIESFKLTPFINEHPATLLGNVNGLSTTDRKRVEGVIGEQVRFEYPYLRANIRIYSNDTIESIQFGKEEVSAGYRCSWEPREGVFKGQPYQYVQRNIRGNHTALVSEGRSGPDVAIMDSAMDCMTFTIDSKEPNMAEEQKAAEGMTLEAVVAALETLAPQVQQLMAFVQKLKPIEEAEHGTSLDESKEESDYFARGVEYGEKKEKEEPKKLDSEHESEGAKRAMDEDEDKKDKEAMDAAAEIKALRAELAALRSGAMDSGKLFAELSKRDELARKLSDHIGTFACDSMSFDQVAKYGAEKLGLKVKPELAAVAVEAYLHNRPVQRGGMTVAMDSGASTSLDDIINEQLK